MEEQVNILLKTIDGLNATIASLSETQKKECENHRKEVDSLNQRIKDLTAQVAYLNRQLFGRKSEKLSHFPGQLELFADEFAGLMQQAGEKRDEVVAEIEEDTKEERWQKRQNRIMMETLPVLEREVIEPEGIDLSIYKKIGEEVSRIVMHQPGMLYVKEIVRPKYGLKDNTTLPAKGQPSVLVAPMPLLPIYKGIADASLLAEILLQKNEYHVPFYRQIKQFTHLGMKGLKENTIDGRFKKTMGLLKPLYLALVEEVMKSDYNQADETTTPVMDKERHKAAKEYLWMVRAFMERLAIFHYDEGSRSGAVMESLADRYKFKGYLQCDGFAGYETAFKTRPGVTLVNCMVHIRRHFEHALDESKAMAEHALTEIQHLYKIEHLCDAANLSPEERKAKRNELARPIMEAMKVWMETEGISK